METTLITPRVIENGMTYREYRELITNLLSQNKTTGENQSAQLVDFTRLNDQRMSRLDKTIKLTEETARVLRDIGRRQTWLVLTEGWCGDAAQNVPLIAKMAEVNDKINLKFILRDQHTDIMDAYLTNGGRSIPKLVALDADSLEELFNWGPRPGPAQEMIMDYKKHPEGRERSEVYRQVHKWYADDKSHTAQQEIIRLIREGGQ